MIYRCRSCQEKVYFGCLPSVSCGLLLMVYASIGGAISWTVGELLWRVLPHWVTFAAIPALAVLGILMIWPLAWASGAVEWLLIHLTRCRRCGGRRWSWGFTEGFGL